MPNARFIEQLTDPSLARVKAVRRLTGRSARQRDGLFVVEGPQAVREAVVAGAVRDLYITDDALHREPELAHTVDRIWTCTDQVMLAMAETVTPQGVIAVCHLIDQPMDHVVNRRDPILTLLAGVQDPGNVGAIIRTADAAGCGGLIAGSGTVDVYNPKVVRSTVGSLFHLAIALAADAVEAMTYAQSCGYSVLAAGGRGELDLLDLTDQGPDGVLSRPTLWVFGNEANGLTDDQIAAADACVRIPIYGQAESLNVATAAAVCLYASARAHRNGH